jgi:hypothetical protein
MTWAPDGTTRRSFLPRSAAAVANGSIVPGCTLGLRRQTSPSEKLNLACIGVGGRGRDDVKDVKSENLVALGDVDSKHAAARFARFPQAKTDQDFRRMFDELEKQIDAVVVSTPDGKHAVAVLRALRLRKPAYSEKPLAHSIREVRVVSDKGKIVYGSRGAWGRRLIPQTKMDEYGQRLPAYTLPRSPGHYPEWVEACKTGRRCGSHVGYGGPRTSARPGLGNTHF